MPIWVWPLGGGSIIRVFGLQEENNYHDNGEKAQNRITK